MPSKGNGEIIMCLSFTQYFKYYDYSCILIVFVVFLIKKREENSMKTRLVTIDAKTEITSEKKVLDCDITPHTHDCYEIEFVFGGKAIHTINGYSYEISTGDIYLISPSDFHSIHTVKNLQLINIKFTEQFVSPNLLYALISHSTNMIGKFTENEFDNISAILYCLVEQQDKMGDFQQTFSKNLCECILIHLLQSLNAKQTISKSNKTIYSAALFINRNFKNAISLETLALETGYSKNYFSKLFNDAFGMGINQYITQVRLSHAKKMLISTKETVTDVGYTSGFPSFTTFSREFKKKFGITPSEYRKQHYFL